MAGYQLKLKRKQQVAEGTLALYFDKPDGFSFKAGQCVRLGLVDPPETDDEGQARILSLASTPGEPELMVATRIRDSAFKRVLKTLEPGADLTLKGPYGDFTLPGDPTRELVFITGGIGITPVRSMLLQAIAEHKGRKIILFYANRRPEDAAFLDELTQACATDPNCTLVAAMSQAERSAQHWQGECGHVDRAMLARHLTDITRPVYYLDGPPGLVAAMRTMLVDAGVAEDQLRTEEFAGY
ncbi:ferredoxin-NADP reductase [Oceanisphaera litoralis]|uniref:ferredoxin--NADP reductase n=1 Tax=Oceanisphaera litoralis TaxID=225144 RepID=UPI001956AE09|nr:FAD-dependent oxidoreductase [Oceanisphaera litoralis]MBM7457172.1 ferredoxin-NADP reductase [Oceanisphaera litoralis]